MSKPAATQQTIKFPRVEREAPILMPFVVKKEKGLKYHREKLGPGYYEIINESFEEVINKAVDLFVLANQSPRGFKLFRERRQSNPEKFRKEMAERYELLDDLQKAYVDLDRLMTTDLWKQRYGDICLVSALSMIAAGAMLFIDQQIDKQLKPQKHVTWRDQVEGEESQKATKLSGETKSQERSANL
jgi:hypothetical protein